MTSIGLQREEKIYVQRFLCHHVLSDVEAQNVLSEIHDMCDDDDDDEDEEEDDEEEGENGDRKKRKQKEKKKKKKRRNASLEEVNEMLDSMNVVLKKWFGLEVRTVAFPVEENEEEGGEEDVETKEKSMKRKGRMMASTAASTSGKRRRYHAIVNVDSDEPSKKFGTGKVFSNALGLGSGGLGPHDIALFRKILQSLIESNPRTSAAAAATTTTVAASTTGRGCEGRITKMDIINLRTRLEGPHKDKLSITQAEYAVQCFLNEKWLELANTPAAAAAASARSKRRKSSRRSSARNEDDDDDGVEDDDESFIRIGPRTYLELSTLLTDLGLAKDALPQFILHRS